MHNTKLFHAKILLFFFQEKPLEQKIKAKECEDSKWQIKMYDPYLIGIP
jgi:hypothetical protein